MSISKLLKSNNLIFFVIALVLMGFAIHSLGNRKNNMLDGMAAGPDYTPSDYYDESEPESESGQMMDEMHSFDDHSSGMKTNKIAPVSNTLPREVKPVEMVESNELLPNNTDDTFFNSDLINAGRFLQQSSEVTKNANLQLRSDPLISKMDIGPFSQSTIEPDTMRPQLEINNMSNVSSGVMGVGKECPMWQSSLLENSNNAILPPSFDAASSSE